MVVVVVIGVVALLAGLFTIAGRKTRVFSIGSFGVALFCLGLLTIQQGGTFLGALALAWGLGFLVWVAYKLPAGARLAEKIRRQLTGTR